MLGRGKKETQDDHDRDAQGHDDSSGTESEEKATGEQNLVTKAEEQQKANEAEEEQKAKDLVPFAQDTTSTAQKKSDMSNMVRLWKRSTSSSDEKKALEYYEGLQK